MSLCTCLSAFLNQMVDWAAKEEMACARSGLHNREYQRSFMRILAELWDSSLFTCQSSRGNEPSDTYGESVPFNGFEPGSDV